MATVSNNLLSLRVCDATPINPGRPRPMLNILKFLSSQDTGSLLAAYKTGVTPTHRAEILKSRGELMNWKEKAFLASVYGPEFEFVTVPPRISQEEFVQFRQQFPDLTKIKVQARVGGGMNSHIETLIGFRRLEHLHLASCEHVTGDDLMRLLRNKPLKSLALGKVQFLERGTDYLYDTPLEHLELKDCSGVVLETRFLFPKNLRSLVLENSEITDRALPKLAEVPRLKSLRLRLDKVTNEGLAGLNQLDLEELDLSCNFWLNDTGIRNLGHRNSLRSFGMGGCSDVTDAALAAISKNMPNLEHLHIDATDHITAKGLKHLSNLPLKSLSVADCKGLNDDVLSFFQSLDAARLQELTVNLSCCFLSDDCCEALKKLPFKKLTLPHPWHRALTIAQRAQAFEIMRSLTSL